VPEVQVQERRRRDSDETVHVARLDAVLVEIDALDRVDDFADPHEPGHGGHEDEALLAIAALALDDVGAHTAEPTPRSLWRR
jgi:hypothetical protein